MYIICIYMMMIHSQDGRVFGLHSSSIALLSFTVFIYATIAVFYIVNLDILLSDYNTVSTHSHTQAIPALGQFSEAAWAPMPCSQCMCTGMTGGRPLRLQAHACLILMATVMDQACGCAE